SLVKRAGERRVFTPRAVRVRLQSCVVRRVNGNARSAGHDRISGETTHELPPAGATPSAAAVLPATAAAPAAGGPPGRLRARAATAAGSRRRRHGREHEAPQPDRRLAP